MLFKSNQYILWLSYWLTTVSIAISNLVSVALYIKHNLFSVLQERHAILTIRDGSKFDTSQYRIVAENDQGMDSAIINIQISG